MGWTSYSMHKPIKEWFKETWNGDKYEVVDSALVKRNTLYGAVKVKETGEIFCAVFLIRWSQSYYNFSYKNLTEHSGPCQCECPQKIMNLLSPLDDSNDPNGWAREWRKRVNDHWTKLSIMKEKKDFVIKSKNPISFTNGQQYQYFKKIGRRWMAGILHNNIFQPHSLVRVNLNHYEYEFI